MKEPRIIYPVTYDTGFDYGLPVDLDLRITNTADKDTSDDGSGLTDSPSPASNDEIVATVRTGEFVTLGAVAAEAVAAGFQAEPNPSPAEVKTEKPKPVGKP